MQEYTIGIDIGTGSTKAVAVDLSGKAICSKQSHYEILTPKPGYSIQEPLSIWKEFQVCIRELVDEMKYPPSAISLSSAMHSVIPVDAGGNELSGMITWADSRSEDVAAELRSSSIAEELYKLTGTPIHAMSPLCKLIWLKENEGELFARADKFISIKEFIWFRLFSRFEIDYSIASATGLFNIINKEWHQPSLGLAGIIPERLSVPVNTSFQRRDIDPKIAGVLGIPANIPFVIGASDGCSANLGTNAVSSGIAALTIGTSGAVRVTSGTPVHNFRSMIFNYCLDESTFICGGPVNNGGNVIQWLIQTFLEYDELNDKAYNRFFSELDSVSSGAAGLIFLPYINGERAPHWDTKTSGSFIGIKPKHNQKHFLRAGLEGVCYALKNVLEEVEGTTGAITQINVSGGFVASESWVRMLADITGKKICLINTADGSAVGAAMLGWKAIGRMSTFDEVSSSNAEIISPGKDKCVYEKHYPIFKALYPALLESMHQLHELD